jgi:hypothetical protein
MSDDPVLQAVGTAWGWTGINPVAIEMISPFGHLLVRDTLGHYWYLDVELRTLEKIARSHENMVAYMNRPEVHKVWNAETLVQAARARLGELPEGHCYTFRANALLSGDYSVEHLCTLTIPDLISFVGDVERQTRNLPAGATFELKVGE